MVRPTDRCGGVGRRQIKRAAGWTPGRLGRDFRAGLSAFYTADHLSFTLVSMYSHSPVNGTLFEYVQFSPQPLRFSSRKLIL